MKIVPNVNFILREDGKYIKKNSEFFFKNKKIVFFALPGAFTPTCSDYHLPSYEQRYDEILQYGVDEIYCLSMNDPFVQNVWKENFQIKKVKFIPDGNGEFTKAMNMLTNRSEAGMGIRSLRYSMYVDDMNILKLFKDENGKFDVSDSNTMINYLKTLNG